MNRIYPGKVRNRMRKWPVYNLRGERTWLIQGTVEQQVLEAKGT